MNSTDKRQTIYRQQSISSIPTYGNRDFGYRETRPPPILCTTHIIYIRITKHF